MRNIRLKIDITGTIGDEAWSSLKPFSDEQSVLFGPEQGSGGPCHHPAVEPHRSGEWWGAIVTVEDNFLAEYALPHYLEQPRVLDAFIDQDGDGP